MDQNWLIHDIVCCLYDIYKDTRRKIEYQPLVEHCFRIRAGEGSPTDTALLSAGSLPAWVAYRQALAKVAPGKRNFPGKPRVELALDRVHNGTDDARVQVAKSLKAKLSTYESVWNRRVGRVAGEHRNSKFDQVLSLKFLQQILKCYDTGLEAPSVSAVGPTYPGPMVAAAAKTFQYLSYAKVEGLETLFPTSLVDAILRQPHPQNAEMITANITMTSTQTQDDNEEPQCQMSFVISTYYVERIAKEVFGAQLVRDGARQSVIWPGGLRLRPRPHLLLEEATWEGIWKVLGPEIHGDIVNSASNGGDIVWMLISENSGDSATLSVRLRVKHAAKWRVRMYTL